MGMRPSVGSVFALNGGFIAGVVLFEGRPGIEPLPIVLAIVCAVAAPAVARRIRRASRQRHHSRTATESTKS
jgi:hypothetical protein